MINHLLDQDFLEKYHDEIAFLQKGKIILEFEVVIKTTHQEK